MQRKIPVTTEHKIRSPQSLSGHCGK